MLRACWSSLTVSAIISFAPCSAAASSCTSSFTKRLLAAIGFCSLCINSSVASGSSPCSRAICAFVLRFGLNGKYKSSSTELSQQFTILFSNSSVSFPCSLIVFKMVSLRLSVSSKRSFISAIRVICTSSRFPVRSFRYLAMKGMVQPSFSNVSVASTFFSDRLSVCAICFVYAFILCDFWFYTKILFFFLYCITFADILRKISESIVVLLLQWKNTSKMVFPFLFKEDSENCLGFVKIILLKSDNCALALRKRLFCAAKPTLLPCKRAAFGMQNNRFCNALTSR